MDCLHPVPLPLHSIAGCVHTPVISGYRVSPGWGSRWVARRLADPEAVADRGLPVSWPFSSTGGPIACQPPVLPIASWTPPKPLSAFSSTHAAAPGPQRGLSIPAIPRPPQSKGAVPDSQRDASRHESRRPHTPETVHINFENLGAGAGHGSADRCVDVNEAKRRKALDSRVGAAPGGHERENTKRKAHDAVGEPSDGEAKHRREEAMHLRLRMKIGYN
ncbi:hypothetical protein K438DRAFT_1765371 [Mycena galopus ATCC 62051]|nr:hypothetical protein K438DRAFT_1765371 [Mycena galopus ATCC 62051]